jgi:putative pyruvate formate lyase activating enzyme
VETLQSLEGIIDIYLPDFKYMDSDLAFRYSGVRDYPEVAAAAIQEMYRQKGSSIITDERGIAQWGLIIRHLVLPGRVDQSQQVLKYIAEEISPRLHLSLMSQYYPTMQVRDHPQLNRTLTRKEYQRVISTFFELGFSNGWTQEMESHASFQPSFSDDQPFQ